jgi:hypothetical protein
MAYRIPNKRYNTFDSIMLRYEYLMTFKHPTYRQAMEIMAIKKWNNDKLLKPFGEVLPY